MNSCLYECTVTHHRFEPKRHRFVYRIFQFYLDLDEIGMIAQKLMLVSRNRFNVFNFQDADHLQKGKTEGRTVKENILEYMRQNGVDLPDARIMLLTNLRTFGYGFNPVSFYFCFDINNVPVCAIAEVGNTFGEIKPYFLGPETFDGGRFAHEYTKHFYVSPFLDLDTTLKFQLQIPAERLLVRIDDSKEGRTLLHSSLTGKREPLTGWNLLQYSVRFPWITLKVITAIHWQAFLLYLKGIPHHRKAENPHLQQGFKYGRNH